MRKFDVFCKAIAERMYYMILKKYKLFWLLLFALIVATVLAVGVCADDETPTVPIDPPDVTAIKLTKLPTKTFYLVGEKLDMSGAELELTYDTGAKGSSPVKLDWTSGFNSSKEGEQTVTVTYPDTKCKATFKVEVVSEKSLKIVLPKTVTYFVGDSEDRGGLSVSVVYSNGKSVELSPSDYTVKGFSTNTVGEKTITVTYKKLTATYKITVFEPALTKIEITKKPNKLSYYIGEKLDTSGMTITAYYENGKTANVTSSVKVSGDISSAGTKTITVSYTENDRVKTATYQVSVVDVEVRNVVFATYPQKTEYFEGEYFDPTGISVIVTYNNGKTEIVSDGRLQYTGFDSDTVGEKMVTLYYNGFQLDFTVRVSVSSSHVHKESVYEIITPPSCTTNGTESTTCTVCFEVVSTRGVPAKGHGNESMPIQTKAPSCTEAGSTATYCMDCGGAVTVKDIAPLGHTEGEVQYITTPTCTTGGLTKTFCTVCAVEVNSNSLNAYGHTFGAWTMKNEPTGETDGKEERVCSVCSVIESNVIPKLVHTISSGEFRATLAENEYFPYYSNFYGSKATESLSLSERLALTLSSSDKIYDIVEVFDLAVVTAKGDDFVPSKGIIFSVNYVLPHGEYSSFIVYDGNFNEVAYFAEDGVLSLVCEGNGRYVLAGEVIPEKTEEPAATDSTAPEDTESIPVSGADPEPRNYVLIVLIIIALILMIIIVSCVYAYTSKRY